MEAKVNPATKFGSVLVQSCTVVYICFKGMHCELRTETGKLFDKDKQMESSWAWLITYYLEIKAFTLLNYCKQKKLSDISFTYYKEKHIQVNRDNT